MRAVFLAALALAVAGQLPACSRDGRTADTNKCIAQAQKQATQQDTASAHESAEERHDRIGAEVTVCMEKLGYSHDDGSMTDARCIDDVDFNPTCYRR